MTKKKVFVVALAVCLVAILSLGTLAWFNAQDDVTNKFMIADSDDDADDIFSVDVWEKTPESDADQDGAEYKDILPGDLLDKEVYVENTGYYDQYVRVTITISDAQAWVDALGSTYDPANLFVGYDATMFAENHIWNNLQGATTMPENLVYVMYLKNVLPAGQKVTLFTDVQIPETLTREQAAAFVDNDFTVSVKAEAVQVDNVVPAGTAAGDAAYEAFKTVFPQNP